MKYSITILLLACMASMSYSQDIGSTTGLDFERNFDIQIYRNNIEKFEGTPFYNDEWVQGQVILNSKSMSNGTALRYSSYSNELFFMQNGELLAVSPNSYEGFILQMKEGPVTFKNGFKSSEYDISGNMALEVIYEGDVKLLTHHEKKIYERQSDPMTQEFTKSFNSLSNHYLVDRSGTWHELDLDDGDIIEALGDNEDAMEEFADEQDIDFEDKGDLKMFFKHYESLIMDENK